jgi:hypothetical protein
MQRGKKNLPSVRVSLPGALEAGVLLKRRTLAEVYVVLLLLVRG